jgi:RecB family endonuclease NucS
MDRTMIEAASDSENSIWLSPRTSLVFVAGTEPHRSTMEGSVASSAKRFLESVIERCVVIISAAMRVEYHGRASSVASLSPRIMIMKPDGTLIVHEDTKHRPINWQPPGTRFSLSIGDDSILVLEALRRKDRESVVIHFDELYFIAASKIVAGEFSFSGSESQMVDLVSENPSLIEPGFTPERREFRTRHGKVDLVGKDKEGNILVLEFKRRQAQLEAASQLGRYVQYFSELRRESLDGSDRHGKEKKQGGGAMGHEGLEKRRKRAEQRKIEEMSRVRVRGGIVAPAITEEALALLRKMGYEFFRLEPRISRFVGGNRPEDVDDVQASESDAEVASL